jgi:hypothetical protein
MVEWGPPVVTKVEIQKMEEDGLELEGVMAMGWHLANVSELCAGASG